MATRLLCRRAAAAVVNACGPRYGGVRSSTHALVPPTGAAAGGPMYGGGAAAGGFRPSAHALLQATAYSSKATEGGDLPNGLASTGPADVNGLPSTSPAFDGPPGSVSRKDIMKALRSIWSEFRSRYDVMQHMLLEYFQGTKLRYQVYAKDKSRVVLCFDIPWRIFKRLVKCYKTIKDYYPLIATMLVLYSLNLSFTEYLDYVEYWHQDKSAEIRKEVAEFRDRRTGKPVTTDSEHYLETALWDAAKAFNKAYRAAVDYGKKEGREELLRSAAAQKETCKMGDDVKTPSGDKKSKDATPSRLKTGETCKMGDDVKTPSGDKKSKDAIPSGGDHTGIPVDTPHKTPATNVKSPKSHVCKSCNMSFQSEKALQDHHCRSH